jgi:hypothetical protein
VVVSTVLSLVIGGPAFAQASPAQHGATTRPTSEYPELRGREGIAVLNALRAARRPPLPMPFANVTGSFWTPASLQLYKQTNDPWVLEFDETALRKLARDAATKGWMLVINIEAFPLDVRSASDQDVERSTRKIATAIRVMREAAPSARIGFYGFMPHRDYWPLMHLDADEAWTAANGRDHPRLAESRRLRAEWARANERLSYSVRDDGSIDPVGFSDLLDVVNPSLYLFYANTSPEAARVYVRENLRQARTYGKPVYPFLWPMLHSDPGYVPLHAWAAAVREAVLLSDGIILWSDERPWDAPTAMRVRLVSILAESHGMMTDRQLGRMLREEFPTLAEIDALLELPTPAASSTQPALP